MMFTGDKEDAQKRMMKDRNILQNYLNIPIIEIEQLNPRILGMQGVMEVSYRNTGGDADDIEASVSYQYDWVGGELSFIENPYPRPPIGTGKIALLCDDEMDPMEQPLRVPDGAKSGNEYGWNKEFLASHYGECYWKIVDPEIDKQVRERYFNILCNTLVVDTEGDGHETVEQMARRMLKEVVDRQAKGIGAMNVNVRRMATTPQVLKRNISPEKQLSEIEKSPLVQQLVKQNKELQETVRKLIAEKGNKEPNGKAVKKLTKKQVMKRMQEGRKKKAEERKKEKELAGNLAG